MNFLRALRFLFCVLALPIGLLVAILFLCGFRPPQEPDCRQYLIEIAKERVASGEHFLGLHPLPHGDAVMKFVAPNGVYTEYFVRLDPQGRPIAGVMEMAPCSSYIPGMTPIRAAIYRIQYLTLPPAGPKIIFGAEPRNKPLPRGGAT